LWSWWPACCLLGGKAWVTWTEKKNIASNVTVWVGQKWTKNTWDKMLHLDGPKIGWEQLSHCDSWSKILWYKCLFFGWTNSLSTLRFGLGPTVSRTK
jgi:hypothetical protein